MNAEMETSQTGGYGSLHHGRSEVQPIEGNNATKAT